MNAFLAAMFVRSEGCAGAVASEEYVGAGIAVPNYLGHVSKQARYSDFDCAVAGVVVDFEHARA